MLVSILIPTLNRLDMLRASLDSARAQDGVEVEIIVSDDGSTDGTREYVAGVSAIDRRVRLLTDNPTPGIFENVSHLIASATGDAYCVLGDDDLLDRDFARRMVAPLVEHSEVVLSIGLHRVIDSKGRVLPRATRRSRSRYGRAHLVPGPVADPVALALSGGVWLGFTMYRRSAFAAETFDSTVGTAADWDFAIRAATRGSFYYVGGPLASYRDHGGTASRRRKQEASESAVSVLERHRFPDEAHERMRLGLLADRAKRHAFQMAAYDRPAARRSLAICRRLNSGPGVHHLLAELMLRLPRPAAALVHRGVTLAADFSRSAQRHLLP